MPRTAQVATATQTTAGKTHLRADAHRNREQVLLAARDVFIEQGPGAPLDDIARRAGVGIATLYRRFPDRQALIRALAFELWVDGGREARLALTEEPDAFRALARYMHRALDLRIAAAMPALVGQLPLQDEDGRRARDDAVAPVQAIIDAAQTEGTLRPDVAFADIGLMLIRLSRPLQPFDRTVNDSLAHRHLELLLDGLRADRASLTLPGPAVTLDGLRAVARDAEQAAVTTLPAK